MQGIRDSSNRLIEVDKPDGSNVTFTYDADGNRVSKSLTSGTTTTTVSDVYQLGHLAYQTDGAGTVLATFSYDDQGVPTSVVLGTDPVNGPRYSYVYNGHGDVVALTFALSRSPARVTVCASTVGQEGEGCVARLRLGMERRYGGTRMGAESERDAHAG